MRTDLSPLILAAILGWTAPAFAADTPSPPTPPPHHAPAKPAHKPKPNTRPEAKARTPLIRAKPAAARRPVHPAPLPPPVAAAPPAPDPAKEAEPTKGSSTGNPLPRFATLRSDDVNLRTGPGTRYPIDWVYKRRDLPVLIEREFDAWRLVQDSDGIKGWVHQATLTPRRTAVVTGAEHVLRSDRRDDADPVARLKPGVILRLRTCEAGSDWCQATVQDYRGYIRRTDIWGLLPGEIVQ